MDLKQGILKVYFFTETAFINAILYGFGQVHNMYMNQKLASNYSTKFS